MFIKHIITYIYYFLINNKYVTIIIKEKKLHIIVVKGVILWIL